MPGIDLHMHSIYSDGSYTPAELVAIAQEKGLTAISLTDHDTINGLDEARQQAESHGIRFIDGVEINSYAVVNGRKVNIHVLGYGFDKRKVQPYMMKLKGLRNEHNQAIAKALLDVGIDIDYVGMVRKADKSTITRLQFAKELIHKGYVKSVNEALERYLHKGGSAFVEYNSHSFAEVAQVIHDAGGIVSLAHPAEYKLSQQETEGMVRELISEGLDAIECIHPSEDAAYSEAMSKLAAMNHLHMTGGSDFHGPYEGGAELGAGWNGMMIPERFVEDIDIMN